MNQPATDQPTASDSNTMMKGVFIAAGITVGFLATLAIPIVHFFSVPLGPFVAGLIGGGAAKADQGKILVFGGYVALLMAIPAALLILIGFLVLDDEWKWLLVIVGAAVVPYTWWAVTIGALGSYLMRRNDAK